MVFYAAHDDWLAISIRENAAEIPMQFLAQAVVAQKRAAFLG